MDNQYGAALGGMVGDIGNEEDHNIAMSPELMDAYLKAKQQESVNPIGANNGLPEGVSNPPLPSDIDLSLGRQDLSSIQAPGQILPPSPSHGIFGALRGEYNKPPQSYSSDFLHQIVNTPTPQPQVPPKQEPVNREPAAIKAEEPKEEQPDKKEKELSPVNFGQDSISTVANLKEAQDKAERNRKQANLFAGLDLITAGLNHANPVMQDFYKQQLKDAGIPVENFMQQVDQEKKDPNSAMSKGFKDYLKQFGINAQGDFSAADAEKLMPSVLKSYEAEQNRQAQKENLTYKYKELKTIADIKSKDRQEAAEDKKDVGKDKAYTEMRNRLEAFRGNSAVQQASRDILAGKKALKLFNNPEGVSVQDLRLGIAELAKIAQGGVPTERGQQELMPDSYAQKLAQFQNFFANKPTDAQAREYIKHNVKYLNDIVATADDTLKSFHKNIMAGYKDRIKPEKYNETLKDYGLKEAGGDNDREPQSSPQPQQPSNLGGVAQQMGMNPNSKPLNIQPQDPRIDQAKAHGYTDEEIKAYLNGRR